MNQLEDARLTSPHSAKLVAKAKAGDPKARCRLVDANDHLVRTIARKSLPRAGRGIELEDLVQEGWIAFFRAIDSYEPERGKIDTYVSAVIRNGISDAAFKSGTLIQRPTHVREFRHKMKRANATADGWCREKSIALLGRYASKETIDRVMAPDSSVSPIYEFDVSSAEHQPSSIAERREEMEFAHLLIETSALTDVERDVIDHHHGIGKPVETFVETSKRRGCCEHAARMAHKRALAKLRKKADIMRADAHA